ncbi:alpha/beta hydrolase [Actinomycetaceae bacterium MB13-C1-2]|nr:alpha/beta hydrolase [Actinomycetaceae bacterium MB13-C1-2]
MDSSIDWSILPPGTEAGTFDAPSGRLATATWGPRDGVPVLLLPGITGSKEDFSLIGPALGSSGYRAVAVDLAGQFASGDAGPDESGHWSLDLHTEDALAILRKIGPAHLVGYSYSGVVASRVAVTHPELLRSVVYLSAPPLSGDSFRKMRVVGALSRFVTPKMGSAILRGAIRNGINWLPRKRKEFIKYRLKFTQKQSVDDTMETMMAVPDYEEALATSPLPRLVTAGSGDLWSLKTHRAFADRVGAEFKSYRSGHSPAESKPKEYARDLIDFFHKVDEGKLASETPL